MSLFLQQVKQFSKNNWWVYLVFCTAVFIIFKTHRGDPFGISLVFFFHFLADIFVMMMLGEYAKGSHARGTWCQIFSYIIFLSLKIHSGFAHGHWQYLGADPIYFLAALKSYLKDVKHYDLKWVNTKTMSLLALFTLCTVYLPLGLIHAPSQAIQFLGIFLFAVGLSSSGNEKIRYLLTALGTLSVVIGSGFELIRTYQQGEVVGLALSFFLLPMSVLIVYVKLWKTHFPYGFRL